MNTPNDSTAPNATYFEALAAYGAAELQAARQLAQAAEKLSAVAPDDRARQKWAEIAARHNSTY